MNPTEFAYLSALDLVQRPLFREFLRRGLPPSAAYSRTLEFRFPVPEQSKAGH